MNNDEVEVITDDEDGSRPKQPPSGSELAVATEIMPDTLTLLPLSDRPFFPPQTLPIVLDVEPWLESIRRVGDTAHHLAGLVLGNPGEQDTPDPDEFAAVGTAVRVHEPMQHGGQLQFIAEGIKRFRIREWIAKEPPYVARVEYLDDVEGADQDEMRAYGMAIINTIKELLPLNPLYSEELKFFLNRFKPTDSSPLTDFAASLTTGSREGLQEILETVPLRRRMERVLVLLKKEVEVARLQTEIREQVEQKVSRQQREFFLKEQLKAIQQELGIAKDDKTAELDRFRKRLEALELPNEVREKIEEEMNKLSILETGSPEYGVTRNYLDSLTSLPWGVYTKDRMDLKRARRILDRDHDGLGDVKDRIIEFLAVGALKGTVAGSILLLVGPPGVGKTSIGHSVADALDRRFYRFSVGGMRDEAEIKGHRRTYIGAMPGKVIQALKEVKSSNPVIMLDEIDKIGASFQGDPASALLEVLDPEQNSGFLDHYLDVRFDLSKALFICTANQLDTIPKPLLDRMEVIRLSGYITAEKLAIAKHHLWPRQLDKVGLKRSQLKITDAAIRRVIEGYAREAGVRGLEKQLGRIARKAVVKRVNSRSKEQATTVTERDVVDYLGQPLFHKEEAMVGVGVVTGLAWTPLGGATLNVEAARIHAKNRGFKLTGQLGEVMRESAEIAYSYVAANARAFGITEAYFDDAFIHLHVPEGATPKDGPSAGITMATALLSLALGRRPKRSLAMTGELTLTGKVLPVGGIREKVIAARRSGIRNLILPRPNESDFNELPDYLKTGLKVHFAATYREVADVVFAGKAVEKGAATRPAARRAPSRKRA